MAIPERVKQYLVQRAVVFCILLVAYVLSIGPMFWYWFEARHFDRSRWILVFYEPLRFACRIDFISDLVNWYIRLWIL